MNSSRLRAGIIIGLIAVCAAIAGAAVERQFYQHRNRRPPPLLGGPGSGPGRFTPEQDAHRRADMLDRMTKELTLSANQRAGIDSVMQHTDSVLHGIRVQMQPQLEKVLASSRAEIDARLDAEQRAKFEKMVSERRGRRP